MRTVKCKNCGASFDDDLSSCPYCGTMNKKGAYAEFRRVVSSFIDSMLGLKDDVQKSVSKIILSSIIRGVILIAVIVGAAFVCSRFANVNYYNHKEYDQEAYEDITWLDENLDQLNKAYESDDFKTIDDLYFENSNVVRNWTHYPMYCLKKEYSQLIVLDGLNEYRFSRILYFLFYPEYYSGYNTKNKIDLEEYEKLKDSIYSLMERMGYSPEELADIYKKCADSYGYVSTTDLKEYMKEAGNGQL